MYSYEEVASYLHALKQFNKKDQRYLQDIKLNRMKHYDQAVEVLSSIKSLSKTDAVNLLKEYGVIDYLVHCVEC